MSQPVVVTGKRYECFFFYRGMRFYNNIQNIFV